MIIIIIIKHFIFYIDLTLISIYYGQFFILFLIFFLISEYYFLYIKKSTTCSEQRETMISRARPSKLCGKCMNWMVRFVISSGVPKVQYAWRYEIWLVIELHAPTCTEQISSHPTYTSSFLGLDINHSIFRSTGSSISVYIFFSSFEPVKSLLS